MDKGIDFLVIKLDGASRQVTGTAGMQVDPDPLSKIIRLVYIQSESVILIGNRFYSANHYSFYEVGMPGQESVHTGIASKR